MNDTIGIHAARQTLSVLVRNVDRTTKPVIIEISGKAMAALVPVNRSGEPFIPRRDDSSENAASATNEREPVEDNEGAP